MKLEQSEKLLVEELLASSIIKKSCARNLESLEKLTGDASTRRYYRAKTDELVSYVVCLDEPSDKESEFTIVQRCFFENGVRVPEIIDNRYEKGYILEEDLGNETLLLRLAKSDKDSELNLYKRSIDELLKIHKIDTKIYEDLPFSSRFFDVEKLNQETEMTNKYFLEKYLRVKEKKIIEGVKKSFSEINQSLQEGPFVVTHRDYHSRNIMLKDDDLVVIDFQDARMGLPVYDLVSLLEDCYYNLSDSNKENLKEYYFEKACNLGIIESKDLSLFEYQYDLMTLQRVYKAIGSFSYIYAERGDIRYLKYIGFAFEKIRLVMGKHEGLKSLKNNLSQAYYGS